MGTYSKPSALRREVLRLKRNCPSSIVQAIDSSPNFLRSSDCFPLSSRSPSEDVPFFIVGSGRSGNTLLRNILVDRFDVCIPPEIPGLGNTIRSYWRNRSRKWPELVDATLATFKGQCDIDVRYPGTGYVYNLNSELGLNYEEVCATLHELDKDEQSLEAILLNLYRSYRSKNFSETDRIGDKTPWNAFHLSRIKRTFPSAKYIHMVRDSRAVVNSYITGLGDLTGMTVRDATCRWNDAVKKCLAQESMHADRWLTISYESLVQQTDETIELVANFLSLSRRKESFSVRFGDEKLPHYKNSFDTISSSSLDSWRRSLSKKDIDFITKKTRAIMKEMGYVI